MLRLSPKTREAMMVNEKEGLAVAAAAALALAVVMLVATTLLRLAPFP
jgi:hypothetical protein